MIDRTIEYYKDHYRKLCQDIHGVIVSGNRLEIYCIRDRGRVKLVQDIGDTADMAVRYTAICEIMEED